MGPYTRRAVALAVTLVVGSACSAPPEVPPSAVSCSDAIDRPAGPPEGWTVVADAVALELGAVLTTYPTVDDAGTRFAKSALLVRSDAAVELSSNGQARIGWGGATVPSTVVRVPRCPGPEARWLVFPGGYWSNGPACVRMTVSASASTEQVTVGLDRAC